MSIVRSHVKVASESDFSFAKFRVLANINRSIDTVGEIADLHGVSQPAISKLVENLVKDGLVLRKQSKLDRRVIQLKLSAKGKSRLQSIKNKASLSFEPSLNSLNIDERKELSQALECLEKYITKIQEMKS